MATPPSPTLAALNGPRIAAAMGGIGIPIVVLVVFLADGVPVDVEVFIPVVIAGSVVAWVFATWPLTGWRAAVLIWIQMGLATVGIIVTGWSHSPLAAVIPLLLLFAALTQPLQWFLPTIVVMAAMSSIATLLDPNAHPSEWAEFVVSTVVMSAIGLSVNVLTHGRAERGHMITEREERFRGLAENAGDGVYLLRLEPQPRFEYVNPAFAETLGVTVEQVYADPELPVSLVHEADRDLQAKVRSGSPEPVDIRIQTKAGQRWVSIVTQPIHDDEGRTVAVQGVVRDITRRREIEDALTAATAQQREAADERARIDAMRDGFLRAVTHEVRTPLTTIRGMSELLVDRGDRLEPSVHLDLARRIDSNARRLELLLVDVMEAARGAATEDGDPTAAWQEPTDLQHVTTDVLSVLDLSGRDVVVRMPDEPVSVSARHVRRILDVFLHNVLRHTPDGTPVEVHGTVEEGDVLHLTVADRGPGVDLADHEDVFRAFHQGSHTYGDASPGTGIGLAIVAQYTQTLGGRCWVEDRDGGGATFHATMQANRTTG